MGRLRSGREGLADAVRGRSPHRRDDVCAEVGGDPQGRVTEPLRDHFQLHASGQRHVRVRVPEVVETNPRKPCLSAKTWKWRVTYSGQGSPILTGEDQARLLPRIAPRGPFEGLSLLLAAEHHEAVLIKGTVDREP